MKKNNEIEPVQIFAGTIWEAEMVKSLLENAEIEVYIKDEINGTMIPWNVSSGGVGSVKLIVSNLDEGKARIVVKEYEKNRKTEG